MKNNKTNKTKEGEDYSNHISTTPDDFPPFRLLIALSTSSHSLVGLHVRWF